MKGKSAKRLSKEFMDYMIRSSLPSMKKGLISTCLLFILFVIFNIFFFRDFPEQEYFMRFGSSCPLSSCLSCFFMSKRSGKTSTCSYPGDIAVAFVVFYVGAFADLYRSRDTVTSYAWTMLVFMGTATFYRIRLSNFPGSRNHADSCLCIGLNYQWIISCLSPHFANNLFFMIAIASIGYFIVMEPVSAQPQNFIHHKALEKNYHELLQEIRERNKIAGDLIPLENQNIEILNTIPDSISL